MKIFFACLLIFSDLAQAADGAQAPLIDHVAAVDVKALQGRLDPAMARTVADAQKAEIPAPLQSPPAYRSINADIMTTAFDEARVPDCLHSEGLKRQPTFFLTGYLALPFIAVAKLRGKCT